jgi:hypothetical protein
LSDCFHAGCRRKANHTIQVMGYDQNVCGCHKLINPARQMWINIQLKWELAKYDISWSLQTDILPPKVP